MNHLFLINKKSIAVVGVVSIMLGTILNNTQAASAGTVRSGFDSNTLSRNDDDSTGLVSIGFDVDFFGLTFDQLYVNNNGNVTFDVPLRNFTPFPLTNTGQQIIAPFFADVDTRSLNSSEVTYGIDSIDGRDAFGVNWVDVGFYEENDRPLNSFQLVLIDRADTGVGNFDIEFNYDRILWETGEASGGDSNGLGGNSARVGYSNGTAISGTFFELPGSAVNGAFLDDGVNALISNSLNSEIDGRYLFSARNGDIIVNPNPQPTPEPASLLGLLAVGIFGTNSVLKSQKNS